MFVKKLAVVSAVVLLSACSSFGDKRVEKADSVTAEFMGGEIKITYNKDGQFESMTASGSKSFDKDTKTVLVVVKTSVRDIATANQVRALMGN